MEREIKFRVFENENARNRMFQWDEIKKHFSDYLIQQNAYKFRKILNR